MAAKRNPAASLRDLARRHAEAALQVLVEVATTGNSEASRISAATALLDRGFGKSGSGAAGEESPAPPMIYHRIELIDGTKAADAIVRDSTEIDPDRAAAQAEDSL